MSCASIFGVIIGKFYYEKKLYSIILFKFNKDLKVGFHCTILSFDFAIHLWVADGIESLLDVKEIA